MGRYPASCRRMPVSTTFFAATNASHRYQHDLGVAPKRRSFGQLAAGAARQPRRRRFLTQITQMGLRSCGHRANPAISACAPSKAFIKPRGGQGLTRKARPKPSYLRVFALFACICARNLLLPFATQLLTYPPTRDARRTSLHRKDGVGSVANPPTAAKLARASWCSGGSYAYSHRRVGRCRPQTRHHPRFTDGGR
jgi:hypothetical protein